MYSQATGWSSIFTRTWFGAGLILSNARVRSTAFIVSMLWMGNAVAVVAKLAEQFKVVLPNFVRMDVGYYAVVDVVNQFFSWEVVLSVANHLIPCEKTVGDVLCVCHCLDF